MKDLEEIFTKKAMIFEDKQLLANLTIDICGWVAFPHVVRSWLAGLELFEVASGRLVIQWDCFLIDPDMQDKASSLGEWPPS